MAEKDLAHTWLILGERTHTQINGAEQALMTTHGGLIASVKRQVDSQENQLTEQYRIAIEGCRSQMNQAEKGLKALWEQFKVSAWRRTDHATENAERLFREIVGQDPKKTLRRGFALVRDTQGEPITSQAAARQQARLTLSFHDGSLSVKRDINDE